MAPDPAQSQRLEEERRLVERAQSGDRTALRTLFDRYSQPLYAGVLLPRLGDTATAEDVLRDTFLVAIEKIGTFVWQGRSLYGWLRQIAVNKVIDVHRRAKRSGNFLNLLAGELQTQPYAETADARLIAAEETRANRRRIQQTMERLNPRYREAVQLRLVEERSREECAQRLDVTVGHFDVILFRAVRSFRKHFAQTAEEEE